MYETNSGINEARHHREDEPLPTGSGLHRHVYTIVIGLAVWFVFAVWIFAGGGVSDHLLFIVSGFVFVCIALTLVLASVTTVEKLPTGEPPDGEPLPDSKLEGQAFSD
jgi:hypothetical protein